MTYFDNQFIVYVFFFFSSKHSQALVPVSVLKIEDCKLNISGVWTVAVTKQDILSIVFREKSQQMN